MFVASGVGQPPPEIQPPVEPRSGAIIDQDAGQPDRPPVMPPPVAAESPLPVTQPTVETAAALGETTASQSADAPDDSKVMPYYGLWSLAPAIVAIVLAIATRQVILALSLGILTAAGMMVFIPGTVAAGVSPYNPITIITYAVDHYLFKSLAGLNDSGTAVDHGRLKILIFTLMIGGMVGVIQANGGTRALVDRLTRRVHRREQGQIRAFLAGLAVFFDDYANAMIVGPSMRPIFDRLKLSREKLAYIVDSTAAPVASIFIGTWLATEISYLDLGLDGLEGGRPDFLVGMSGTVAFWGSIPYRTYALLALVMVFLVAITGRDFGAMRKAESLAVADRNKPDSIGAADDSPAGSSAWLALLPVLALIFMTMGLLAATGWNAVQANEVLSAKLVPWDAWLPVRDNLVTILGESDANSSLLYASLTALAIAIGTTSMARALPLAKTMDAVSSGVSRMAAACIVLALAWGLSDGGYDLQLGDAASVFLQAKIKGDTAWLAALPVVIFVSASIVSFATGTSWGTMGILCPAVVTISASVMGDMPSAEALPLFYASVGAVLTGAVFGDHCSPISDTTVLSSIASECELGAHVWTQMPYALVVAVVGMASTDGLNYALGRWAPSFYDGFWGAGGSRSQYYGLAVGVLTLVLIIFVFGRRPRGIVTEPAVARTA